MTTINLGRVVGENGEDGRGITSITKTGTSGLIDTYTITYTDNTTSTFEVTNGEDGSAGTTDYTDLSNKPKINNVELSGNKSLGDLGVQAEIDSTHKLSADNVDDTSTTNKFVTTSDKTTWSGKQDALVSGTNIKTINNTSILGSGNIDTSNVKSITPTDFDISMEPFEITITLSSADCADIVAKKYDFVTLLTESQLGINITCAKQANSGSLCGYFCQIDTGSDVYYYSWACTSAGVYDNVTKKIDTPSNISAFNNDVGYITSSYHDNSKQDTLVSGTNIKTINNNSILGSGNITIEAGSEEIGDLEDLKTISKDTVVDSINEVYEQTYDEDATITNTGIAYTIEEEGCVLKDGTIGTNEGGRAADYYTYKFIVDGYDSVLISGRQFRYSQFNATYYPWGDDACFAVAYDENDTVLQYWQLTPDGVEYTDYKIELPAGTSYIKVSASITYTAPAVCKYSVKTYAIRKLPDYWLSYLETKKDTIMSKCNSIGANGDSFIFITDIHGKLNYGKSPLLIHWLLAQTPIRKVIMGGDLWSDGNNIPAKADLLKYLYGVRHSYNYTDDVFAIRGNHDVEQSMTEGEWYSMYERNLTERLDTIGTNAYFYVDNTSQKIRYIFCDGPAPNSAMPADQQTWLQGKITELAAGWTVLVFCHSYWKPAATTSTPAVSSYGSSIKTAIDTAVSTANATVAALITGHVHRDMNTTSSAGYAIVATTCDANDWLATNFDPVTPTRTAGTTTEQAFDVFNIDTSAKKIYITRIGGNGTDRTLTYS